MICNKNANFWGKNANSLCHFLFKKIFLFFFNLSLNLRKQISIDYFGVRNFIIFGSPKNTKHFFNTERKVTRDTDLLI